MTTIPDTRCVRPSSAFAVRDASMPSMPMMPSSWLDRELERISGVLPRLGRVSDGLLATVTLLFVTVDLLVWATDPSVEHGRLSFSIAIAVPLTGVVALVMLRRRRHDRAGSLVWLASTSIVLTIATVLIGTGLPPSTAVAFVLAVTTAEALRVEPGGRAVALAALSALAMLAEAVRPMVPTVGYLVAVCSIAVAVEVSLGVYLRWTDWRRETTARWARNAERLEIARELHDVVGHHVTGIVVRAQAARHVAERRPEAALDALAGIEEAGAEAMAAMRRMVGGLREDAPTGVVGSWDDVERLLADAAVSGVPLRVGLDPSVRLAAPALAPAVLRIVGESLTNVRRHARRATVVDVGIVREGERVVVTVRDDGGSATLVAHDSYGIVGMRERAESLGGSLTAGPHAEGGWSVRAELPLGTPEPAR